MANIIDKKRLFNPNPAVGQTTKGGDFGFLSNYGPILQGKYHIFNREASVFGNKDTYSPYISGILDIAKFYKSEVGGHLVWQRALTDSWGTLGPEPLSDFVRLFLGRIWANEVTDHGGQIKFLKSINDFKAKGYGFERIALMSDIGKAFSTDGSMGPIDDYIDRAFYGQYFNYQLIHHKNSWYLGDIYYGQSPLTPVVQKKQNDLVADVNSVWRISRFYNSPQSSPYTKGKPIREILEIRYPNNQTLPEHLVQIKGVFQKASEIIAKDEKLEREYYDYVSRYIRPDSHPEDVIGFHTSPIFQNKLESYEEAIKPDYIPEHTLPDHHAISMEVNTFDKITFDNPEFLPTEKNYHQFVTLAGKLDVFVDQFSYEAVPMGEGYAGSGIKFLKAGEAKTENYHQKWAKYVSGTAADHPFWSGGITPLDHFKNTILLDESIRVMEDNPANITMYPFYNKISFYTEPAYAGSLKPLFFGGSREYTVPGVAEVGVAGLSKQLIEIDVTKVKDLEYSPEYSIVKRIMEAKQEKPDRPSYFRSLNESSQYIKQVHDDWTVTPLVMTDGLMPDELEEAKYVARDTLNLTRFARNLFVCGGFLYNYYLPKTILVGNFPGQEIEDPANPTILDVNDPSLRRPKDLLLDEGSSNSEGSDAPDANYTTFFKDYSEEHYMPFLKFIHGVDGVATPVGPSGADQNEHIRDWIMHGLQPLYSKTRSFSEILDGKLAHSETIGYVIEKIREGVSDDEQKVKKRILFLNSGSKEVFNYVDSQVKYGVGYKYVVTALQLIVGTRYAYKMRGVSLGGGGFSPGDGPGVPPKPGPFSLRVEVESVPDPLIVELPYFETPFIKVVDLNPTPPEVEPIPFKNNDRQFLFNLREGSLTSKQKPINIFSSTQRPEEDPVPQYIHQYINAKILDFDEELSSMNISTEEKTLIEQKYAQASSIGNPVLQLKAKIGVLIQNNFPLIYKTDDIPVSYEVFRLGYKPTSYMDFGKATYDNSVDGNYYKEIPLDGASSIGHFENIVPNKKYYYIFRAKDSRGNMSNPTSIYEIELVNNSGAVYLATKIFEFQDPKETFTKPMRKLLQVRPTYEQSVLDENTAGVFDNWAYGPQGKKRTSTGHVTRGRAPDSYNVPIGLTEESLFRDDTFRKFKVRLTSKSTGRKMDFILRFSHNHNKTPEEDIIWESMAEIVEDPMTSKIIPPDLTGTDITTTQDPDEEEC